MKTRKLGSEGLEVSTIGLGCMGMTVQYGELDDEQSVNTIHHALDIGVNLINSADMYGWGKNEELISKAIKDRRSDVILNTKFVNTFNLLILRYILQGLVRLCGGLSDGEELVVPSEGAYKQN